MASPARLTLRLQGDSQHLSAVRAFVGSAARQHGLHELSVADLKQAVSEVVAGLIEGDVEDVEITINVAGEEMLVEVSTPVLWRVTQHFDRLEFISDLLPGAVDATSDSVVIRMVLD